MKRQIFPLLPVNYIIVAIRQNVLTNYFTKKSENTTRKKQLLLFQQCPHIIRKKCFFPWPFPKQQIVDASKFKAFADDNFEIDENGGKFSKTVENAVRKGEIVCSEQFPLFPLCHKMTGLDTRIISFSHDVSVLSSLLQHKCTCIPILWQD